MGVRVVLVDLNAQMVAAWKEVFHADPTIEVMKGSILEQHVDAWVSPTNSSGDMSGGVDAAIRGNLGEGIQKRVQQAIKQQYSGSMPVGYATCVPTGRAQPAWLISTPTMVGSAKPIQNTLNVALACCAAFQALVMHNERNTPAITSIALPGLGTGTGRVPVDACAELMWTAYSLFHRHYFADFESMRSTLEAEVNAMDQTFSSGDAARRLREVMSTRPRPGE